MSLEPLVQSICAELSRYPCVQGVFLGGSLANDDLDAYSDIDMGVVSGDDNAESRAALALRSRIVEIPGPPLHFIERGWGHCRLIAALYGKSLFPPVGLELDVIFSQLQHVGEQMAYSEYRILFDRSGSLSQALKPLPTRRPDTDAVTDLRGYFRSLPFWVHDAQKALRRGDLPQFQTLLDAMRQALFALAAARQGASAYGSKRGFKFLTRAERDTVTSTYGESSSSALQRLTLLLLEALHSAVASVAGLDADLQSAARKTNDILSEFL